MEKTVLNVAIGQNRKRKRTTDVILVGIMSDNMIRKYSEY